MNEVDAKLVEMKFYTNLFTSLQRICASKCISKYNDSELTVGESVCAERCTEKWMETFKKVQAKLHNAPPTTGMQAAAEPEPVAAKKGWF
ncbi:hypothetical protein SAMD00019534_106510 [Acytostelium subglobosum LB1]|uniref:hypothetical protein n=1 Tax=Acytostelium subglobosum LB1 TaxID=1410327 RepID=UPI000644A61D|nr:hypothetical protein SAMD00019534_106510 [Acytostelium subglobosum LB1]GAM27475.1 hypothetical protein SAMD00019534_106510 [Acytostelium subglobosum LB1]|eukprot:XP_012749540.1 hypothetical protein SAMD00019534_106510 [Acytostelium subglobosum LB1]